MVERDFRSISRGYDEALRKFSELKQKQLEAEMAQTLESGSGAEQWQIVSAAFLPTMPESPNRIGILLLGGLLAFAAGVGYVAIAEQLDKTVRSVRIVTATLGVPPLAVIPRMRGADTVGWRN
jgi:polysaccharide biosynthesis transport protein